jgi:hypothetical protein
MALMSPATTPAEAEAHTAVFASAADELLDSRNQRRTNSPLTEAGASVAA